MNTRTVFYYRLLLQASFSLIVMFVCTYKILISPENDNQRPVYWALLSATATSWMPSPLKSDEEDKAITSVEKTVDMIAPQSNKQGE
jgi:hypothetical protein